MGRAKEMYMDIEHAKVVIELIIDFLRLSNYSNSNKYVLLFEFLSENLDQEGLRKTVIDKFTDLSNEVERFDFKDKSEKNIKVKNFLFTNIINEATKIDYTLNIQSLINKSNSINSIEYFENQISSLKKELDKSTEKDKHKEKLLIDYQIRLKEAQREKDIKNNWEKKITETFSKLESNLKPIEDEKKRINVVYWVFLVLSVVLVVFIFVLEGVAFHKLCAQSGLPTFKDYIILFIPVPVAGALLWGFIYQMNRAQRQLVVLAKRIHSIKYVEGLLLAINNLSASVDNGIERVNLTLDKMIANHLNEKEMDYEAGLLKEENKDSMPIDSALKIIDKLTHPLSKKL